MPSINPHGGRCCGICHLWNFSGNETVEQLKRWIKESTRQGRVRGQLVEVVLTDKQIRKAPKLLEVLKEVGFAEVCNFVNINSGNRCHVFHYHKNLTLIPYNP